MSDNSFIEMAKEVVTLFYQEKDIKKITTHMSNNVVWIGPGVNTTISGIKGVENYFSLWTKIAPECRVSEEDYILVESAYNYAVIAGQFYVTFIDDNQSERVPRRISLVYRREDDGEFRMCHIHVSNSWGITGGALPPDTGEQRSKQLAELLTEKDEVLDMVTQSINAGLKGSNDDETYSYFYVSEELCTMLGYTKDEFVKMSGGSATGAIYPPDLQSAKEQVEACFSKGNEYKAEYRIRKKDGSLMWVMDSGRKFTDAAGATKINSILTDITSLKNTVEQLRLAQSRYQIALGSITSVLFEYDFKEDSLKYIFHEGNQVDETRRESTLLNFKESLFSLGQVHKDDVERAWNVFSGKEKEAQVRVTRFLMKNDGWYWVVISSTLFCDSAGEPVRTIGTIKDVTLEGDDKGQKTVRHDSLTGLMSPNEFQRQASEMLGRFSKNQEGTLFILRLGQFDRITEKFGSLFAYSVLISIANKLQKMCQHGDILGRLSREEFILFSSDSSLDEASERTDDMLKMIRNFNLDQAAEDSLGCNIGLASTLFSRKYETLFRCADTALEASKAKGENSVFLYQRGMRLKEERKTDRLFDQSSYMQLKDPDDNLVNFTLEIFEKSGDITTAIDVLFATLGRRFRLDRITLYTLSDKYSPCQWVSDSAQNVNWDKYVRFSSQDAEKFYEILNEKQYFILNQDTMRQFSEETQRLCGVNENYSVCIVELRVDNNSLGLIAYEDTEHNRVWSTETLQLLWEITKIISSHLVSHIKISDTIEEMDYKMTHDELTGLLYLEAFKKKAASIIAKNKKSRFAVLYTDIREFKYINRLIGYHEGDVLLQSLANYLQRQKEIPRLLLGRISGDYFVGLTEYNDSEKLKEKINKSLARFCKIQNEKYGVIRLMIRTGVYLVEPEDHNISLMIDRANVARKNALQMQPSAVVFYDSMTAQKLSFENKLVNRMDYALVHEEFQVYLQPKVALPNETIVGAEALVRWNYPDGRILAPDWFIPLFEQNGSITRLDDYMLEQVLRLLNQEKESGRDLLPISVNLSCLNAQITGRVDEIKNMVDQYQIDHSLLEFELTESAFAQDPESVLRMVRDLHEEGFRTSIDDLGAGYSILNLIVDIPVDVIKVDRMFIVSCSRSSRGRRFLSQLVNMLKQLNYTVLCEGVESIEQEAALIQCGFELAQGYLFGKPMLKEDFLKLVENKGNCN